MAAGGLPGLVAGLSLDGQSPMKLYYNVLDEAAPVIINNEPYKHISISTESQGLNWADPSTIVFLGEGNFTFCTAFADYRGSWQGIVPTTLYAAGADEQLKREENCKLVTKELYDWNKTLDDCCDSPKSEMMKNWKAHVVNCTPPVRRNLDATAMGDRETLKNKLGISRSPDTSITLWFQHPCSGGDNQDQKNFVQNVVTSAAAVQKAGEFFLMGLYIDPEQQYSELLQHLQNVMGDSYQCVGVDTEFVSKMADRGYQNSCDSGNTLAESCKFATFLLRRTTCGDQPIERTAHQEHQGNAQAQYEMNEKSKWKLSWNEIGAVAAAPASLTINEEEYQRIRLMYEPDATAGESLVFLGEGNFTFCTAFAASRGSWQGVVPTNFWHNTRLQEEVRKAFEAFEEYRKEWEATLSACCEQAKSKELQRSMAEWNAAFARYTPPVRRHLDATDMGTREHFAKELGIVGESIINMWFQCPWKKGKDVNFFLQTIFASAANVQAEQERLLIGVCKEERYVYRYEKLQEAAKENYTCHGADQEFVGEMLSRGYKHLSDSGDDLGLNKSDYFRTLVFTKNG